MFERFPQVGFGKGEPGRAPRGQQQLQPRLRAERRQAVSQSLIATKALNEFQS
jgi:hypothetical protein